MGITPALIIDIAELFQNQFGTKPYVIKGTNSPSNDKSKYSISGSPDAHQGAAENGYNISSVNTKAEKEYTTKGSLIREKYLGVEIFMPINIYENKTLLMYLPYCVIGISGKNDYQKTPMIERSGTVKELYSEDDYTINIKGFIIGADRKFPEAELEKLKLVKGKRNALVLDNALTNIFLTDKALPQEEQRRVVIDKLDIIEVHGGREHVRPFTMQLTSDTIFKLELE